MTGTGTRLALHQALHAQGYGTQLALIRKSARGANPPIGDGTGTGTHLASIPMAGRRR